MDVSKAVQVSPAGVVVKSGVQPRPTQQPNTPVSEICIFCVSGVQAPHFVSGIRFESLDANLVRQHCGHENREEIERGLQKNEEKKRGKERKGKKEQKNKLFSIFSFHCVSTSFSLPFFPT